MREYTLNAFKTEKLVAILRRPDKKTLLPALHALFDGGLRLVEVTFDRAGIWNKADTCAAIAEISREFKDELLVGAGTVLTEEEVRLAKSAGARFIVSPDCDSDVISATKSLGMVSVPAAFTPTEIAKALKSGADFIKIFPANTLPNGYIKAVKAPLADAKLFAFGGITEENAEAFLSCGFDGVGVGNALYNESLAKERNYEKLSLRAARFKRILSEP